MDENEDSVPEWYAQPETKAKLKALNGRVDKARADLFGKCATSSDPDVRAAHATLQSLTAAAALLKPAS